MLPMLMRCLAVVSAAAVLTAPACADLRQGNVREKGTCRIPPYDCLYTQSGWHYLENGWQVFGETSWSDGESSCYFAYPLSFSCDALIRSVYIGGGFGYFDDTIEPDTFTLDIHRAEADPQYREVSGCCLPDPDRLIARYTFNVDDIWPAQWSDVQYCRVGKGEINYYDDFEKLGLALDPPLEVDSDCPYFVSFYSNGEETTGFWLTYGMQSGANWIAVTRDAGHTFEPYGGW
jgi:hypothetical protein